MDAASLKLFQTVLQAIASVGISMADKLMSTGMAIFLALLVLITVLMFIQLMSENVSLEELAPRLIKHVLNVGFVGLLLTSYAGGTIGVRQIFIGGSDYLVQKVTGQTGDSSFEAGVAQINNALKRFETANISGGTADPDAGLVDQTIFAVKSGLSIFTGLTSVIIGIVVCIFLAIVFAVYISVYMLGVIMLYIGITMGPFMIPWKLLEASNHMFSGWLRFTTAAAFYKVVCAIVLAMLGSAIDALVSAVEAMNTKGNTPAGYDMMYAVAVLALAAFMAYVMWQVPKIANGLVSGSGGADGRWFSVGGMMK